MQVLRLPTLALALWHAAPISAGACDRPGTPTDLRAKATNSTTFEVSWRNTARSDETIYWDVEEKEGFRQRDGTFRLGVIVFPHRAGMGNGDKGYGLRVSYTFPAQPGTIRCFHVKARTARKRDGCLSEVWSNTDCAMTPPKPVGVKELPGTKAGPLLKPSITVQRMVNGAFQVRGIHFTPGKQATVVVSGAAAKSSSRLTPIRKDGHITSLISDACGTIQGQVIFSAQDPDKGQSNRIELRCRTGLNPGDVKLPP